MGGGMNAAQHTPGPWRVGPVDDTRVEDANGNEVAQIDGDYNQPETWPLMEANARLIAAAPDLLHSLKEISDMFMARPDMVRAMQPLRGFAENAVFDRAAAAIAKAEGR